MVSTLSYLAGEKALLLALRCRDLDLFKSTLEVTKLANILKNNLVIQGSLRAGLEFFKAIKIDYILKNREGQSLVEQLKAVQETQALEYVLDLICPPSQHTKRRLELNSATLFDGRGVVLHLKDKETFETSRSALKIAFRIEDAELDDLIACYPDEILPRLVWRQQIQLRIPSYLDYEYIYKTVLKKYSLAYKEQSTSMSVNGGRLYFFNWKNIPHIILNSYQSIATGSYKSVYVGKDLLSGKKYVISQSKESLEKEFYVQRYFANHSKNIIKPLMCLKRKKQWHMISKFGEQTLYDAWIILDPEQRREALLRICEVMILIHKKGGVYGDLKSNNAVMRKGKVRLIDFGQVNTPENFKAWLRTINIVPEVHYHLAPECVNGRKIKGQVDVYALGAMWYGLINRNFSLKKALNVDGTPYEASWWIKQALNPDPKERATMEEMMAGLAALPATEFELRS